MDPILCVSPHLDDAVLSAGQFLAGWPGAYVYTVFGGRPDPALVTGYDSNSGFKDSDEAIVARNHEDDRAMWTVRAKSMRADFPDNQYRMQMQDPPSPEVLRMEIMETILGALNTLQPVKLLGPVGIGHPDHAIVADAVVDAARRTGIPTWLYEEIPYRVLSPEAVPERLPEGATLDFVGAGKLDAKKEAVRCYASQMWALDENVLWVPERFWKLAEWSTD